MGRIVLIAFRNIFAHTRRSAILAAAIAFVCFILVSSFAASTALQDAMVDSATTLASGHVNIGGFYKASIGVAQPQIVDYAKVEQVIQNASPHVAFVQRRARGKFDRVTSEKTSLMNAVGGLDFATDRQLKHKLTILEGDINALEKPGTALMFKRQADELGVKVGDAVTISGLTARGVQNRMDVKVSAIAKDMGGLSQVMMFLPEVTLNELYEFRQGNTGVLMIFLDDKKNAVEVSAVLRKVLKDAGFDVMEPEAKPFWMKYQMVEREDWTGQKLDVSTWRDELGDLANTVDALDGASVVLTLILLSIIAIGLWNTLMMAVRERTPEIGALRAIGMSRGKVRFMIVVEAGLLALMASVAGAVLAAIMVAVLNAIEIGVSDPILQFIIMSDHLSFRIDPMRVVNAILFISIFASLAALWPAHRAARIQPGAAMSHAG